MIDELPVGVIEAAHAVEAADHHDGQILAATEPAYPGHQLKPHHAGQDVVGHQNGRSIAQERVEARDAVSGDHHTKPLALKEEANGVYEAGVVLDQQNGGHGLPAHRRRRRRLQDGLRGQQHRPQSVALPPLPVGSCGDEEFRTAPGAQSTCGRARTPRPEALGASGAADRRALTRRDPHGRIPT